MRYKQNNMACNNKQKKNIAFNNKQNDMGCKKTEQYGVQNKLNNMACNSKQNNIL